MTRLTTRAVAAERQAPRPRYHRAVAISTWDPAFERALRELARQAVDGPAPARGDAWRRLLVALGPHVEEWARGSALLRRCRLTGEDEPRAVLVEVIERLARDDRRVLRAAIEFGAAPSPAPPPPDDDGAPDVGDLDRLARLSSALDGEPAGDPAPGDLPLRAFLLQVTRYAIHDHVRRRLGWSSRHPGDGRSKRDVGTDASRLDAAPERAARPPMTDRLTVRAVVAEIEASLAAFPPPQRRALELWLDDHPYDGIARELALDGAAEARKLVRAAQARLRHQFRARFTSVFGEPS